RQAEALQLAGARGAHGVVVERIECGKEPVADRSRARSRELLAADDGAQTGEARLAPAQRERAGLLGDGAEPRILPDELDEACAQVVFGVEEVGHWQCCPREPNRSSSPAKAGDPVFGCACDKPCRPVTTGCPACAGHDTEKGCQSE